VPSERRDRRPVAAVLVALTAGALAAGAVTVTGAGVATPRTAEGLAMSGEVRAPAPGGHAAPAAGVGVPQPPPPAPEPPPATTELPPDAPAPAPGPPPATEAAPSSPAAVAAVSQQQRVVDLVNAERAAAGCRPLVIDQRLVAAAQAHSTDMAVNGYFSHTSLDGRTFGDRILAAGYPRPAAENIARGQRSAEDVMRDWMRSRGHRANILNCDYVAIGVGLDTRGWYWTQDFGR